VLPSVHGDFFQLEHVILGRQVARRGDVVRAGGGREQGPGEDEQEKGAKFRAGFGAGGRAWICHGKGGLAGAVSGGMQGEDEGDDHAGSQQGSDHKGQVLREPVFHAESSGSWPEQVRACCMQGGEFGGSSGGHRSAC